MRILTGGASVKYHFGDGDRPAGEATVIHNPKCPPLITTFCTQGISLKIHADIQELSLQVDQFLYPDKYPNREEID